MVADLHDREHRGKPLLAYATACATLAAEAEPLARTPEHVPLATAAGRVLAAPVRFDRDEPPVPRSAMDGFAVASADGLAPRRLAGVVHAGSPLPAPLAPGTAMAVMTGGTVPAGADCVVPVERTRVTGELLHLAEAPVAGRHVRPAGELGRAGRVVLQPGTRMTAGALMIAASCGADPLPVRPRVRVAVIATGDEVVPWRARPAPQQVRDANRLGVAARLAALGAEIVHQSHLRDDAPALHAGIAAALAHADLLVTIGGVSMGEKDLLPATFAALGVRERVHGVALQPGKPLWIGRSDAAWVIGLPGNPLSSFVVTELFARPLLARLSGALGEPWPHPLLPGALAEPARSRGREFWIPARLEPRADAAPLLHPIAGRGSGDWSALAGADALLRLPPHAELERGAPVRYLPLT